MGKIFILALVVYTPDQVMCSRENYVVYMYDNTIHEDNT